MINNFLNITNIPKVCVYILLTAALRNNPGKAGRSSPQLLVQETTLRL